MSNERHYALDAIESFITEVKGNGLYPEIKDTFSSPTQTEVIVDGKPVVTFCSNNYLGLANDPRVKAAAHAAIDKYGMGCCGSRLISGNLDIVIELEKALADFKGKEACTVFTAGFMANSGTIPAIMDTFMGEGMPFESGTGAIFNDELNHTSIIDGCRLSREQVS